MICEIDLKLPSLNDYVDICRRNRYESANFKRSIENDISVFIRRLPKLKTPVFIRFCWVEKDMRRDADNIAFAKKFILDALVKCGKIPDDSRKYVKGFADSFIQGKRTKVIIEIEEEYNDTTGDDT